MQRHHRIRHRLLWLVIAPAALALVLLAILNRPKWPLMDSLPGVEATSTSNR